MPIVEIYTKDGFGRRLRIISAAAKAGLKHLYDGLYTSIGVTVAAAPSNLVPPSISGSSTVGSVLTVTAGTYTGSPPPALTYQWQADGADIVGETGTTLDTTLQSDGEVITVIETATNSEGSDTATSNGITLTV